MIMATEFDVSADDWSGSKNVRRSDCVLAEFRGSSAIFRNPRMYQAFRTVWNKDAKSLPLAAAELAVASVAMAAETGTGVGTTCIGVGATLRPLVRAAVGRVADSLAELVRAAVAADVGLEPTAGDANFA